MELNWPKRIYIQDGGGGGGRKSQSEREGGGKGRGKQVTHDPELRLVTPWHPGMATVDGWTLLAGKLTSPRKRIPKIRCDISPGGYQQGPPWRVHSNKVN